MSPDELGRDGQGDDRGAGVLWSEVVGVRSAVASVLKGVAAGEGGHNRKRRKRRRLCSLTSDWSANY